MEEENVVAGAEPVESGAAEAVAVDSVEPVEAAEPAEPAEAAPADPSLSAEPEPAPAPAPGTADMIRCPRRCVRGESGFRHTTLRALTRGWQIA